MNRTIRLRRWGWGFWVLVSLMGTPCWAQRPQAAAPAGGSPGGQGSQQEAVAPAVAAPAVVIPPAPELPTPDADGLARYAQAEKLVLLFEFPGIDAYLDAWKATAAAKILDETKTGEMIDELLLQLHGQLTAAMGPTRVTSAEEVAMLRHLMRRGMILAIHADKANPDQGGMVLVFRDAFTDGVKEMFARQVFDQMKSDAKPEVLEKPGGRRVAVTPLASNGKPMAWWVEDRRDIVMVMPPAHVDAVIGALEGTAANVTTHDRRNGLAAGSGERRPLAWGFLDIAAAPPLPPQAAQAGLDGVDALEFQWGADGDAMRTVVNVEAPAPRKGMLRLMEQPVFAASTLPAIPEGVEGVSVLSVDLNETLTKLTEVLSEQQGTGDVAETFAGLEASFKRTTRLNLREDVLVHLGPKIVTYSFPKKREGLAALNALNPLANFQLPRLAILIDVKDQKAINKSITQLMSFANKQLAKMAPAADADANEPAGAGRGGSGRAGRGGSGSGGAAASSTRAKPTQGFEFKMTSTKPVTYQLNMPAQFSAILNAKPTVALGERHLVIATAPDLAAEAVKQEETTDAAWTPPADFAKAMAGLPGDLVYLQVSDPRDSLPMAIADLPMAINKAAAALVSRGMPGMAAPAQVPLVQIVIPTEKTPTPAEIRKYLFPGASAVSVDAGGVHLVMREAFFDLNTLSTILNGLAQAPNGSLGPLPMGNGGANNAVAGGAPPMAPPNAPGASPRGPRAAAPASGGGAGGGGSRTTVPD